MVVLRKSPALGWPHKRLRVLLFPNSARSELMQRQ
jgi:hypothetical protein